MRPTYLENVPKKAMREFTDGLLRSSKRRFSAICPPAVRVGALDAADGPSSRSREAMSRVGRQDPGITAENSSGHGLGGLSCRAAAALRRAFVSSNRFVTSRRIAPTPSKLPSVSR